MKRSYSIILLLILIVGKVFPQNKQDATPWFFIQLTDPQFGMFENNAGFEKETVLYDCINSELSLRLRNLSSGEEEIIVSYPSEIVSKYLESPFRVKMGKLFEFDCYIGQAMS